MNLPAAEFPVAPERLDVAARAAIRTWAGKEGTLSRELQAQGPSSEEFLRAWLGWWMLARANPIPYRPWLATQLQTVVRPQVLHASDVRLPPLVVSLAESLREARATRGLQTSLVSKFAFSLRPESIVPYDRRARLGLSEMFGCRLADHDYPGYLTAFHRFSNDFSRHLDETGTTRALRSEWSPVMSETLFRMRASDKYVMLLGGFPVERMNRD